MKIRNGFVSNSSSSSYVILLPVDFKSDDLDTKKIFKEIDHERLSDIIEEMYGTDDWDGEYNFAVGEIIKDKIKTFLSEKEIWAEDDYSMYDIIYSSFKDNIIAGIDTGPDEAQIVIADRKVVEKIG